MKINNISNIIAIGSVKGGVGKSTITANIAIFLNKKNKRIGILDADIYGPSQEKILGLKKLSIYKNNNIIPAEANNIKIVSINSLIKKNEVLLIKAPIINKLTKILTNNVYWNTLDYLLIDLPPGTGDIHINIMQNLPIDSAIIISSPQKMSFNIAKKSIYMFNSLNIPIIGFIENFSFFSCYNCKKKITYLIFQ
ncbi:MAG: P-loop NTPase [Candidatus Azosocius agrarius]|nr:MAG: P-loop NTPase [Gammaproteobacteria bacterium]